MGDEFVALILLAFLAFGVFVTIGAVRGWIALTRLGDLQRRLASAEKELARLRASPGAGAPAAGAAPGPTPGPTPSPMPSPMPSAAPGALVHPVPPSAARPLGSTPEPSSTSVPPTPPPIAPRPPAASVPPGIPAPASAAGMADDWSSAAARTARATAGPSAEHRAGSAEIPSGGEGRTRAGGAPRPRIEWERWLGVRGAAVLGGISLIVAGFLFLQYSIDRGWVTPQVRLVAGAFTGLAALGVQHPLRKRGYGVLSNSLAGAGLVLLYAVAWAAHRMYGVIEFAPAFGAMVAVTVACAALSYRYSSQLIAVLGLVGGFATPIALSTGSNRPLSLFGYSLLLDLAFLFVAHRRRWPRIGLVAFLCTFVIQGLWIARRMEGGDLFLAIAVLGVFGLLFAVVSALRPVAERKTWNAPQTAALLLPFVYGLYFAQHVEFGRHFAPLALLAGLLTLAGGVLARLQRAPWLSLGTVSGALSLVLVWTLRAIPRLDGALALELSLCVLGLAVIQGLLAEWECRRAPETTGPGTTADAAAAALGKPPAVGVAAHVLAPKFPAVPATIPATIANLGFALAIAIAAGAAGGVPLLRWLAPALAIPFLLLRLRALGAPALGVALGLFLSGAGLAAWSAQHADPTREPGAFGLWTILFPSALALLFAARAVGEERRRGAFAAVAAFLAPAQMAFALSSKFVSGGAVAMPRVALWILALLALGATIALAANGARSAWLLALAVLATLIGAGSSHVVRVPEIAKSPEFLQSFAALAVVAALFTAWPFLAPEPMRARAGAWRVGAASALPWCFLLFALWGERHAGARAFLPALGAALCVGLLAHALARRSPPMLEASARLALPAGEREAARVLTAARVWYGAVAAFLAALVAPLFADGRFEREELHPFAVAAATSAALWSLLWRRIDHLGLKLLCVLFGLGAAIRLSSSALFEAHPSAATNVWNERAYWLCLPAVLLIAAAVVFARSERARLRGPETHLARLRLLPATAILGGAGIATLFAWLNLEVADAFGEHVAPDSWVQWSLRASPRVGLATSIAWALFALAILGLGVVRSLGALRWTSLILFLATIAKVFLLDLAHLRGLYRVAAILGLALSLFLVSFLYQRFVFRAARRAEPSEGGG